MILCEEVEGLAIVHHKARALLGLDHGCGLVFRIMVLCLALLRRFQYAIDVCFGEVC